MGPRFVLHTKRVANSHGGELVGLQDNPKGPISHPSSKTDRMQH